MPKSRRRRRRGGSTGGRAPARPAIVRSDPAGAAAAAGPASYPGLVLLWTVRIGVCLVLLTPLVVAHDVLYPFVVGKALFARSVIEITFACWTVLVLFDRRHRPSRSWVIAAFAVWLLVSGLAGLLGVSPTRSLWSTYERMLGVFDLVHWFAFTLMAGSVFRSAAEWRLPLAVNLVFGTAVSATTLVHRYGLVDVGLLAQSGDRISSLLGNPLYLGPYVAINALLGVALLVQVAGRPARPVARGIRVGAAGLCALMVVVNLWTMWLSGTRSAVVALGAAFLWLAVCAARGGGRLARRTAGAVGALMLTVVVLLAVARTTTVLDPLVESSVMLSRMSASGDDLAWNSATQRLVFWQAGLRAFLDRPVLGWGPENFLIAWGRYSAGTEFSDHAHNKLVEELTTKGVAGLVSYLAVWAVMLHALLAALRRSSGGAQIHLCVVGAALAAFFVQGLLGVDTQVSMVHFSLFAAFAASVDARGRPGESPRDPAVPRWAGASLVRVDGRLTAPLKASVSAVVAALAIASLAYFNVRPYGAAAAAAQAMVTSRPWADRLDDFARSIHGFPALANYPRMYLFEAAASRDDLSEEDLRRTIELVEIEAERGSRAEPQNWLLEAQTASFYQRASTRDAQYVDNARRHVDRTAELAPGIARMFALVDVQENLEASVAGSDAPGP